MVIIVRALPTRTVGVIKSDDDAERSVSSALDSKSLLANACIKWIDDDDIVTENVLNFPAHRTEIQFCTHSSVSHEPRIIHQY